MKIGCKKVSEAPQGGYEVGNRHRKAFLSLGGPILANLGPETGARLSCINAPGGMRGGPGDSRFKLSAFSITSGTVDPEGVAGFNRSAHPAGPGIEDCGIVFGSL